MGKPVEYAQGAFVSVSPGRQHLPADWPSTGPRVAGTVKTWVGGDFVAGLGPSAGEEGAGAGIEVMRRTPSSSENRPTSRA